MDFRSRLPQALQTIVTSYIPPLDIHLIYHLFFFMTGLKRAHLISDDLYEHLSSAWLHSWFGFPDKIHLRLHQEYVFAEGKARLFNYFRKEQSRRQDLLHQFFAQQPLADPLFLQLKPCTSFGALEKLCQPSPHFTQEERQWAQAFYQHCLTATVYFIREQFEGVLRSVLAVGDCRSLVQKLSTLNIFLNHPSCAGIPTLVLRRKRKRPEL